MSFTFGEGVVGTSTTANQGSISITLSTPATTVAFLYLSISIDNASTTPNVWTTNSANATAISTVTDTAGNTWIFGAEVTGAEAGGAAQGGITSSIWWCKPSVQISSGAQITAQTVAGSSGSFDNSCYQLGRWTYTAGHLITVAGSTGSGTTAVTSNAGATDVAVTAGGTYLRLVTIAAESTVGASISTAGAAGFANLQPVRAGANNAANSRTLWRAATVTTANVDNSVTGMAATDIAKHYFVFEEFEMALLGQTIL